MQAIKLINDFKAGQSMLWLENGRLKLFVAETFKTEGLKEKVIELKDQLMVLLLENKIYSKSDFQSKKIFKSSYTEARCSFAQERLWFAHTYNTDLSAYHIPVLYELQPDAQIEGLIYSLKKIVCRHEILRSTIEMRSGQAIQVIHNIDLDIEHTTLREDGDWQQGIRDDVFKPFDLEKQYPLKIKFYTIGHENNNQTFLLINFHHIASDGLSDGIFQSEFAAYYQAYCNNIHDFDLAPLEIQYKDFALWQRQYLSGKTLEQQSHYWKEKLIDYEPLNLYTDYPRPREFNYKGESKKFTFGIDVSGKLRSLAKAKGVTLHSIMLSSFYILLNKYTTQQDIIVGTPIANRHHSQTIPLIGFFVNVLPARIELSSTQSFEELILKVHQDQINAQINQDLPFELLVDELITERDVSRHPIFQVVFDFQNLTKIGNGLPLKEFQISELYNVEKFDLTLHITDDTDALAGEISFASSLFSAKSIDLMSINYVNLVQSLVSESTRPYTQVVLLKAIGDDFVETAREDQYELFQQTIHERFRQVAHSNLSIPAVICQDQVITYAELDAKSDWLADQIRNRFVSGTNVKIQPDTIIALYIERSIEMIISVLAVLKSGAAYLPIDLSYPQDRIDYILNDANVKIILTNEATLIARQVQFKAEHLYKLDFEQWSCNEGNEISTAFSSETDLSYIVYTSGTTGQPKGVMVEHRDVIHFALQNNFIDYQNVNVIAGISNYAFDGSVFDIFFSLLNGKTLALFLDDEILNIGKFEKSLVYHKVDTMFVTTAFFNFLVFNKINSLGALKNVLTGGERYSEKAIELFKQYYKHTSLIHVYGPTENIVFTSYCQLTDYDTRTAVPIGVALADKRLYLLDPNLQPVPDGVIGELYVGGAGVARGYLNQEKLTDERFIQNPFATEEDKLFGYTNFYRTGDIVRRLTDGNIEFIGRNDDQVKIRGYRIELKDITHAILRVNGVEQCLVRIKERETETEIVKYLVGYYKVLPGYETLLREEQILKNISNELPEYMMPNALVQIDAFPLTPNGKLDLNALPNEEVDLETIELPSTDQQLHVSQIWAQTLGLKNVGITDNFFKLGGNSILAIKVSHLMNEKLGITFSVADIFKYQNIKRLLANVSRIDDQLIIPSSIKETRLSFSQERLWFIEQYEQGFGGYHVPFVYELDEPVKLDILIHAIRKIVIRHEVLRTKIVLNDQHAVQYVDEELPVIEIVSAGTNENLNALIQKDRDDPFDLSLSWPVRFKIYENISDGKYKGRRLLLVNFHHIAFDGWSANIFHRELEIFYGDKEKGLNSAILPLRIQYRDYACWQRQYYSDKVLEQQLDYWKIKLVGSQPLSLPIDFHRPKEFNYAGAQTLFQLGLELSQKIRMIAKQYGTTLHNVLLSSFGILLHKYTGQGDIVIGSPIANRHHHQTADLIGFFVNTQVNRLLFNQGQTFEELIQAVHLDQVEAQKNQDLPFEMLIDKLNTERDQSRHPIFQVMFAVQNFNSQNASSFLKHASEFESTAEKFDLSLFLDDGFDNIQGEFSFAISLFKNETIERLVNHFKQLLHQLVSQPENTYSKFSLLTESEYKQIVFDWNQTAKPFRENRSVIELFQQQAKKSPESIALVCQDRKLTYRELDQKSNQLARYIQNEYLIRTTRAIEGDILIPLYVNRSEYMVIAILSILKTGAAYVPVDISYPQDRVNYIISDTNAELLLVERNLCNKNKIEIPDKISIYLDEVNWDELEKSPLSTLISPLDLMYVLYTSGTTGRPKGVMLEHGSITDRMLTYITNSDISSADRYLFKTNYAFDVSVADLFLHLLVGAKIFMTVDTFDIDELEQVILENQLTAMHLVPSQFDVIEHIIEKSQICKIYFSGEALSPKIITSLPSHIRAFNYYGPTEAGEVTVYEPKRPEESAVIGKIFPNNVGYVLDSNNNPVPVGVAGELFIGGLSLARGYLNLSTLTAERFILNPFPITAGIPETTRLYRTGDMVKWQLDGTLIYISRNDTQIKIRGHRIELSEIESQLNRFSEFKQSCVIVNKRISGDQIINDLVIYYTLNNDKDARTFTQEDIVSRLLIVLPDYMVPRIFVKLDTFPLTINGKLDVKALPAPEFSQTEEYLPPATPNEKLACTIWKDILRVPQIGMNDNFFELGGNSILAIYVSNKMSKELNGIVKVADIFRYKTIKNLLKNVSYHETDKENLLWKF